MCGSQNVLLLFIKKKETPMPHKGYTVYVVEADSSVRDALALLLSLEGYAVAMFDSVERFLAAMSQEWLGCVLIDNRLYGQNVLMLQRRLRDKACALPMIVMSALGNLGAMPKALCSAAAELLDKPLNPARLVASVERAFVRLDRAQHGSRAMLVRSAKPAHLDADEREIVDMIARGLPRREIAKALFLSPQAVEECVQSLMRKLGASDVLELPRMAVAA
jgi:FixJ family two-component response regulator